MQHTERERQRQKYCLFSCEKLVLKTKTDWPLTPPPPHYPKTNKQTKTKKKILPPPKYAEIIFGNRIGNCWPTFEWITLQVKGLFTWREEHPGRQSARIFLPPCKQPLRKHYYFLGPRPCPPPSPYSLHKCTKCITGCQLKLHKTLVTLTYLHHVKPRSSNSTTNIKYFLSRF